MHELSIAMEIVRIAENESAKANAQKVNLIELEIGTLAGIEFEALEFVWPSAVNGTILESAKKRITKINGKAKCNDCYTFFQLDDIYDNCPKCGSYSKTIVKGKELVMKSLEVS